MNRVNRRNRKLCLKRLSVRRKMLCAAGGQRDGPHRLFVVDVRIGNLRLPTRTQTRPHKAQTGPRQDRNHAADLFPDQGRIGNRRAQALVSTTTTSIHVVCGGSLRLTATPITTTQFGQFFPPSSGTCRRRSFNASLGPHAPPKHYIRLRQQLRFKSLQ